MRPDEWWKNFGLGLEVDASGAFIYNGIKLLDTVLVQRELESRAF